MNDNHVRFDEMDEQRTTARVLHRMTDPEQIELRKLEKEENEMNTLQATRIAL